MIPPLAVMSPPRSTTAGSPSNSPPSGPLRTAGWPSPSVSTAAAAACWTSPPRSRSPLGPSLGARTALCRRPSARRPACRTAPSSEATTARRTPATTPRSWPGPLGGVHTFAHVGRPTCNAVAERTIRTMNEECIWLRDWRSLAELPQALPSWARAFNHDRPTRPSGGKHPLSGGRSVLVQPNLPEPDLGAVVSPAGPITARSARRGMGWPKPTGGFPPDATGHYTRFAARLVS